MNARKNVRRYARKSAEIVFQYMPKCHGKPVNVKENYDCESEPAGPGFAS